MKTLFLNSLFIVVTFLVITSCDFRPENRTAKDEQALTELNQRNLLAAQPPPSLSWSLERDNLIKRFKLQNDRSVVFYMYVFIEGSSKPIGYYLINKVSSVNSQLTNTQQVIRATSGVYLAIPSPAEDGSYGENGGGVFGFTPEGNYLEHNMHYIVSLVPLNFEQEVPLLNKIDAEKLEKLNAITELLKSTK